MTTLLAILAFQKVKVVSIATDPNFREVQLAVEDNGHVFAVFGRGDAIYCAYSTNRGTTFSRPILVANDGRLSLGMRRGPRIAAYGDHITISAVYGRQGGGQDGDLVAFRSDDGGITWSMPTRVDDVAGAAREGLHAMAVGPDGTLACAWLDLRSKGTKLYLSTSKDHGETWSRNRLVYQSPGGSICECCHPSLAYDSSGKLWIMFRNSLDGNRDMYLTSTLGSNYDIPAPIKLGGESWQLDACPMDGGMVVPDSSGGVDTVWRRKDQVFSCLPKGKEALIGDGRQPWGAWGPSGLYTVWVGKGGILSLAPKGKPTVLDAKGTDPVIASSPNHREVIAAWNNDGIRAVRL
ncbi:MAG: exo-alpha-sialidase [Armatimonadetes bacterium]|nr:exo-alpha-sialidase [Armatimonadota bacterium]